MTKIGGVYRRGHTLPESIAIEVGGVSPYFSKVSGSGVDLTLLRESPNPPKSAGGSAGAGKRGLLRGTAGSSAGRPLSLEKQRNGTAPSSLPTSPRFFGTVPGTFGGSGFLSPVAGGPDRKSEGHPLEKYMSPRPMKNIEK